MADGRRAPPPRSSSPSGIDQVIDQPRDLKRLSLLPDPVSQPAELEHVPTALLRAHADQLRGQIVLGGESDRVSLQLYDDATYFDALVQDLVDLYRLHTGTYQFRSSDLDLDLVIEKVVAGLFPKAAARNATLATVPTREALHVNADAAALSRALFNFAAHFVFHSAGNAVHVRIRVERRGQEALVRIEDTGLFMAPEAITQLFAPPDPEDFLSMDLRPGRRHNLYLCRKMIEGQGGTVEAVTKWPTAGVEIVVSMRISSFRSPGELPRGAHAAAEIAHP